LILGACNTASSPPAAIDSLVIGIKTIDGVAIQPPVGPTEVFTDNFDDEVPLVIELFRLNSNGRPASASFHTFASAAIVVTNTAERQDYQANWHTRQSRLGDGRVRVVVRRADADDADCATSVDDVEDVKGGCLAYFDVELVRNMRQVKRKEPGIHYLVNGSTLPIRIHIEKVDVPPIDDTPFELEDLISLGGGSFDEDAGNCPVYDFEVPQGLHAIGAGLHAIGAGLHAIGAGLHAIGAVGGITVDHPRPLDSLGVGVDITQEPFAEIGLAHDAAILVVDKFDGIYTLGGDVFKLPEEVTGNTPEERLEALRAAMQGLVADRQLSHGAVVLQHMNRVIQGTWYWHSTTPSGDVYTHELAGLGGVPSSKLIVKAVDIDGVEDSGEIAERIEAAISALAPDEIDYFVVNMSFALVPCSIKEDFEKALGIVDFEVYTEELAKHNRRRSEAVAGVISTPVGEDSLHNLIKTQAQAYKEGGPSIINVASSGNFARRFSMYPGGWPEVVSVSSQDVHLDSLESDDWGYGEQSGFSNDGKVMALGAWFELREDNGGLDTMSNHLNPVAYAGTSFAAPNVSAFSAIDFMTGVRYCGLDANGIPKLAHGSLNNTPLLVPDVDFPVFNRNALCPPEWEFQYWAHRDGNNFVLTTPNPIGQVGAVWNLQPVDLTQDFDMSFEVFLGSNDGSDPANPGGDGMTFTLIRDLPSAPGDGGRGLGYRGLDNSLAVELDTYQNADEGSNDPPFNHIAILINGEVIHGPPPFPQPVEVSNLKDGLEHTLRIHWHAGSNTLSVYLDDLATPKLTYTRNLVADIFGGQTHVYFGFTGATGLYTNLHYFRRL
jgi:hypothetical protein